MLLDYQFKDGRLWSTFQSFVQNAKLTSEIFRNLLDR